MKRFFFLLSCVSLLASCIHEHKKTCCSTDSFANLGKDKDFVKAHERPGRIAFEARGAMITYNTPDGKTADAYLLKNSVKSNHWIFVVHEWWGLNDHIKNEAQMIFDSLKNVNILALDLYDGKATDDPNEAGKLMGAVTTGRAENIIKGALGYVGGKARIGTIGWCFGGGWSLQAALLAGDQADACVMYYGMPEEDAERLKTLHTDVLMVWADKDQWINKKVVDGFKEHMSTAGKKLTVLEYAADHAFANPSNPHYNATATADAQKKMLAYFKQKMGQ